MDCKQNLLSNVSPSSISSSFTNNLSIYGGRPNHAQSLYSSGLISDPGSLLINAVPCTIIKEEREDLVESSCQLRGNINCNNMVITNSSNTTLNSNALGSMNIHNSSPLSLNTRLPPSQPEEWSSSSSPGKMSVETTVNGNNPIFGPNGFSPMSAGSYETYSPNGREDMSPPSSINGNTMDSFRESRRNRGPTSRQQEELCLVCGDRASGYHYNALTCEGCKGFFRRSITKNAVYQCKYGNNCEIDMYMRRKCQECRLKKCLKVGMRPECVVPEYQCAVKREAKRAQKDKDKPNSTTKDRPPSPDPIRTSTTTTTTTTSSSQSSIAISPDNRKSNVDDGTSPLELTMEEEELIERLVFFQEEFESPSTEDMAKITNSQPSEDDGENRYKHITEITIYTIRLIVEFAKRVPWFDTLIREDQITLLKACSSELMMLRTARRYDISTDTIVFANDQPYTRENYNSAGLNDCTNALFHFCRQMCLYKVDNAEYALLTAVVLFSDRPHLAELKKVEQVQEIYLEALRKYELKNRQRGQLRFARLLSVLTELRSLGSLNSEMCFSLKLKNKELPPFLAEIWDINS